MDLANIIHDHLNGQAGDFHFHSITSLSISPSSARDSILVIVAIPYVWCLSAPQTVEHILSQWTNSARVKTPCMILMQVPRDEEDKQICYTRILDSSRLDELSCP